MRKSLAVVSAAGFLMFGATGASASTTPWQVMPTPTVNSSDVNLVGVSCSGASDCVAVSSDGAALHWDGSSWAVLPAIFGTGPEDVQLYGISCTSATFCMAAGQEAPSDAAAWLWNGNMWTATAANIPKSADNSLYSIACTSSVRCVAVGQRGNGNGGTTFPSPRTGTAKNGLNSPRRAVRPAHWTELPASPHRRAKRSGLTPFH
jgi:hypothetical protein